MAKASAYLCSSTGVWVGWSKPPDWPDWPDSSLAPLKRPPQGQEVIMPMPKRAPPPDSSQTPPPPTGGVHGLLERPFMSLEEFKGWLREKQKKKPFSKILSQHSTQNPKDMGRPPNPQGVTPNCRFGIRPAIGGGVRPHGVVHECTITLANSFRPSDGLPVDGYGLGACVEDAKNAAALDVLAKLLCLNGGLVRLLDKDWLGGAAEVHAKAARHWPTSPPYHQSF